MTNTSEISPTSTDGISSPKTEKLLEILGDIDTTKKIFDIKDTKSFTKSKELINNFKTKVNSLSEEELRGFIYDKTTDTFSIRGIPISGKSLENLVKQRLNSAIPIGNPSVPHQQKHNKNAYEIRNDILFAAIEWVKFQNNLVKTMLVNSKVECDVEFCNKFIEKFPTHNTVIKVANEFYKFVENKK